MSDENFEAALDDWMEANISIDFPTRKASVRAARWARDWVKKETALESATREAQWFTEVSSLKQELEALNKRRYELLDSANKWASECKDAEAKLTALTEIAERMHETLIWYCDNWGASKMPESLQGYKQWRESAEAYEAWKAGK